MNRFLVVMLMVLFLSASAFSEVSYSSKQGGIPGLFFVEQVYSPALTYVFTNTEERMWYPSLIEITQPSTASNVITFAIDHIISTNQYRGDVVWTNDLDEVLTNYNWGVTNILVLTNSTTIANLSVVLTTTGRVTCVDEYLQKMDVLKITFSTNATWLKIIAKE